MKLSLQLASILSSPKVGPPGLHDKDAFAASMQSLMTTFTGKLTASVRQFSLADGLSKQILLGPTTATPGLTGKSSERKQQIGAEDVGMSATNAETSDQNALTEDEALEPPASPQIDFWNSIPLEERAEQSAAPGSVLMNPVNADAIRHAPTTKTTDALEGQIIYSQSRPRQKGHSTEGHQAQPATSPGVQATLDTVTQGIPVAAQSTNKQVHEISADETQMESRNEGLCLPGPSLVMAASTMTISVGKGLQVRAHQNTQPGASTILTDTHYSPPTDSKMNDTVFRSNQNTLERTMHGNDDHTDTVLQEGAQATKGGEEEIVTKVHADAISQPGQNLLSLVAMHRRDDHDLPESHADAHLFREAERATITISPMEPVAAANSPVHLAANLQLVQHEPAVTVPLLGQTLHSIGAPAETHRPQLDATQVMQKMDTALSSGAMQLRADARHLDIGVTSASLGWLEVRATANPLGRVDAAVQVESNAYAHVLTAQSHEIAEYAREHSVQLGEISVEVGTGDGARGNARPAEQPVHIDETAPAVRAVREPVSSDIRVTDSVSLISVRA